MLQKKIMLAVWISLLIISVIMLGLAAWMVDTALTDGFGEGVSVSGSSSGVASEADCAYMLLTNIGAVLLFGGLTIYTARSGKKKGEA